MLITETGKPYPLGATPRDGGVNFAVFSVHATRVTLCLFDSINAMQCTQEIELPERTGNVWHGFVSDIEIGQLYGFRVDGPYEPEKGHRFNRKKLLLDPYARSIARIPTWHSSLLGYRPGEEDTSWNEEDSTAWAAVAKVAPENVGRPVRSGLEIPWERTVIYETHVRGMTINHPDVDPALRGTFAGLASKPVIAHLKELGVTSIQLLPVQTKFSEENLAENGLTNYWGYNTLGYFAPEPTYAADPDNAAAEFRAMVDRFHEEGMEVIIDVVFNHTAEGNRFGPTLSFRGLDNLSYYLYREDNPRILHNFTGTGNTLDVRQPVVMQLIADSLRYWAREMGVDGFRFDLATVLARAGQRVDMDGPFFILLQQDPVLRSRKMIAEPWDLGPEGYRLGSFVSPWREWNARFRDDVRKFWTGEVRTTSEFASRMSGSSDIFVARRPSASVNFISAHDGFTLADLTMYEQRHNLANLEDNRDGHEPNHSKNWGHEGPTDDENIAARRKRMQRALIASLLLAQGVPMILGGDELGRTQQGNNNAYCQDNEISWFNWSDSAIDQKFLAFVKELVATRAATPLLSQRRFLNERGSANARWWHASGREMNQEDWSNPHERVVGLHLWSEPAAAESTDKPKHAFLMFNPTENDCLFSLPELETGNWRIASPFEDLAILGPMVGTCQLQGLSVALLKA